MKKHITDIRIQNEQPAHCSIFMDGVFFALVEIGLVTKFGLRIGLEIEEIVIQKLIVADEVMRARNHALNLLLRESYSNGQMMDALEKRGFGQAAINETLKNLEEQGHIRDQKYAERWVAGRRRTRPAGRKVLTHELIDKGIDKGTVDRVVGQIDDEDEKQTALHIAQRQARRYRSLPQHVAQRRLRGFLVRRGFDYGTIQRTIKQVLETW